mmetsp:Transcript_52045/g.97641  ORF Transcript_52045/g.97641 Transcript_52045/m.97641 type:complete len:86 (-) Transcript_52045:8-265(-)
MSWCSELIHAGTEGAGAPDNVTRRSVGRELHCEYLLTGATLGITAHCLMPLLLGKEWPLWCIYVMGTRVNAAHVDEVKIRVALKR